MWLAMSPNLYYLIDSTEYPFELCSILNRYFGAHIEEDDTRENTTPPQVFSLKMSQPQLYPMKLFMNMN